MWDSVYLCNQLSVPLCVEVRSNQLQEQSRSTCSAFPHIVPSKIKLYEKKLIKNIVQTFHSFVIKIMTLYLPQYFFPLMHFAISNTINTFNLNQLHFGKSK